MKTIKYHSTYSSEYIISNLPTAIADYSNKVKEFLYKDKGDGEIWIGIEKGDHTGFWYIAHVTSCIDGCNIEGEIVYDPDGYTKDGKERIISKIFFWIFMSCVIVLLAIPILIIQLISFFKKEKTKEEYLDQFLLDYFSCKIVKC